MDNITIIVPESSPDIVAASVIDTVKGEQGYSAYEIAKLEGFEGTMAEWVLSLKGDSGLSAYDVWISQGNEGSVEDYILSLKGEDYILTSDDKKEIAGLVEGFATQEYVDQEGDKTLSAARTFTTQEIEKIPTPDVSGQIAAHNTYVLSHEDIRTLLKTASTLPTYDPLTYKITFVNILGAKVEIDLPIERIGLTYDADTKEMIFVNADGEKQRIPLADFIDIYIGGANDNVIVTIGENNTITAELTPAFMSILNNKVEKVTGKNLSTNDYTDADKTKLRDSRGLEFGHYQDGIDIFPSGDNFYSLQLNGSVRDRISSSYEFTQSWNSDANYLRQDIKTRLIDEEHNISRNAHQDIRDLKADKETTYTKAEIAALIANLPKLTIKIVESLPTEDISTSTIYFIKNNVGDLYTEYMYINSTWEKLGDTDLVLDNYYTKEELISHVFPSLSTTDKTILGAINEVNIKPTGVYINSRTIEDHVLTEEVLAGDLVTGVGGVDFDTSVILPTTISISDYFTSCSFSSDDYILAITYAASPYVKAYSRVGDRFNELNSIPAPTNIANCCSISSDGIYLAVAHYGLPCVTIYKRNDAAFTKMTIDQGLPNKGNNCSISSDGLYVAIAHDNSPYITVYKRNGDSFTKIPALEALPNSGWVCSFSSDGIYLAVTSYHLPILTIYKRTGDTFTKLPIITLPGYGNYCSFSSDGIYLAVDHNYSPNIAVYKRIGDTFTKLPAVEPLLGISNSCSISSDGAYLAATYNTIPFISIHKRNGDSFTKLPDLKAIPYNNYACSFSSSGTYLISGVDTTPRDISVYKATNQYQAITPTVKRTDKDIFKGIAIESGKAGETKQILITEKY